MSQQINLYNPILLKQEKHFSARTMVQALGLIVCGMAAIYAYALYESRAAAQTAERYREQVNAQRDELAQLAARMAAQGRSKALETDVARLEGLVKAKQATLDALGTGELGNTTGFSEFLAAFGRQAMSGVWLTGFDVADSGNDLVVHGRALRPELVPAYLRGLNREEMMRGRRVTEMKLTAKSAGPSPASPPGKGAEPERFVEFTLSAPLRSAAPAAPEKAKGGKP